MAGKTTRTLQQHILPSGMTQIVITNDSTASLTLLAGVAGQVIDVWGFLLSANGTTGIDLKSAANSMTGSFAMINGYPFYVDPPTGQLGPGGDRAFPVCTTNDGEDLIITNSNSGSVTISGLLFVVQRLNNSYVGGF